MKLGIETLKPCMIDLTKLGNVTAEALLDEKVSIGEGLQILSKLNTLRKHFKNWNNIKKEIADLDTEEFKDIAFAISEELDIPQEEAEKKIRQGINLGNVLYSWIRN